MRTIEAADGENAQIHSASDTLNFIDDDLALKILHMNAAFVAGTPSGP